MANSLQSQDGEIGFQIAPMVDVVFVLMLFFMACAGFRATERELSIALPKAGTVGDLLEVAITIDIAPDGRVIANGQSFGSAADKQLLAFRDWLKTAQGACRAAGIQNVTFS